MNTRARAIEIVAVGLGQGGGNIAAELYRRGYDAVALNTATSDLTSLARSVSSLPSDRCLYIGIEGYDGAGGDAAYGRECVQRNADAIRQRVGALAQRADLVLVCAGLGGGTGSAVSELIDELAVLELPVVVLATLPTEHESAIAKVNAVRAINEMVAHSVLGFIFVDNAHLAKAHGGVAFDRYFAQINRLIVEPLDALNQLNARDDLTPIRSLDGEDFRRLMLSSGLVSFSTTTLPRLSAEAVLDAVTDGLLRSNVHPDGYQFEHVTYLGLVIEAPESLLANTPFSLFEWLSEQIKTETRGAAIYLGIYKSRSQEPHATVRVFASSLALPDGVRAMVEQASREGGQLSAKLQRSVDGLELGEVAEFELFRSNPGRRRGSQPEAEHAGRSLGNLPLPLPPAPPRSPRPVAVAPPPAPGTVNRDAYEELVEEFRTATDAVVKRRVMERLERDRKSDDPLVRYYAVIAMTKLDPRWFADSLRSAALDEDATVRGVAIRALQRA